MNNLLKLTLGVVLLSLVGCANYDDHIAKGDKYLKERNSDKAITEYSKALGLDASKSIATKKLSEAYVESDKLDEAWALIKDRTDADLAPSKVDVLIKKIEAKPNDFAAYELLCGVYNRQGEFQKAIELYTKASGIFEGNEAITFTLGELFFKSGNADAAMKQFTTIPQTSQLFADAQGSIASIIEQNGYKGAKWGDSVEQVRKALKTQLSISEMGEYHDFTPEDAWATITFYDLWGVPKTTLDGYPEYDSSHAPSKIKVYQTKSGDYCAFYNGKFYAYYFGMKGSNHAEYLNTLSSKYGNPISHTAGFLRYTIYGKLPCDFMYSSWVNGGTRVVLAKNVYKGTGMIYTAAYNFYISQSITKEIRDYVSSSVERLEAKKRDKQKAAKQADMSKLQ